MARDPVDATLAKFTRWAGKTTRKLSGDPDADARELRLVLDLLRDNLGINDPADMRPGDLDEVLLSVYPRKVTVLDRDDAEDTIPAMWDLLTFLADTTAVNGKAAAALERELDEVAPQFVAAVMDPANWGPARTVVQEMAVDGVDLSDADAVTRWIEHHRQAGDDEHPYLDDDDYDFDDEDIDLKEAFGLPDQLPSMRLPAEDELADIARVAPLLGDVRRLAEWVGEGRDLDDDGDLTEADTAAAARALGIDASEVNYLWSVALGADFLADSGDEGVGPGEALDEWPDGTDEEVLLAWEQAFAFVLSETLPDEAELDPDRAGELEFTGAGSVVAVLLFLGRNAGLSFTEASEMVRETVTADLEPAAAAKSWKSWQRAHDDPARVLLGRLADLGAVTVDNDEQEGPLARMTPLALWTMREQLLDEGVEIPLLPPPEEMTAAELVDAADGFGPEELVAEVDAWLEYRTPETAAIELLALARTGDPGQRMVATSATGRLGASAEPMWRAALDHRELRPYAKIALTEIAGGAPETAMLPGLEPTPEDAAWLLTDVLVIALTEFEPEDLAQQLRESVPGGQEPEMFELMARLPHPEAADVLTQIGKHHPDKRIAKAARKSAYRAATRLHSLR
jgi:hypothetical protein